MRGRTSLCDISPWVFLGFFLRWITAALNSITESKWPRERIAWMSDTSEFPGSFFLVPLLDLLFFFHRPFDSFILFVSRLVVELFEGRDLLRRYHISQCTRQCLYWSQPSISHLIERISHLIFIWNQLRLEDRIKPQIVEKNKAFNRIFGNLKSILKHETMSQLIEPNHWSSVSDRKHSVDWASLFFLTSISQLCFQLSSLASTWHQSRSPTLPNLFWKQFWGQEKCSEKNNHEVQLFRTFSGVALNLLSS